MKDVDSRHKQFWEGFDQSAVEAKKELETINKDVKRKHESATRSIDKVQEKCRHQFEIQNNTYKKFEEIVENRIFDKSSKVYNKYNVTMKKTREIHDRVTLTVDDHRRHNVERFSTRDLGLRKEKDAYSNFLKKENKRHTTKVEARERILYNMTVEHAQKKEMRKLRLQDTTSNLERERKKKQEF